jgi:hypothetical protein
MKELQAIYDLKIRTRKIFESCRDEVFVRYGTAHLSKQLNLQLSKIEDCDVLIRGGWRGHAVIVIDIATNNS